MIEFRADKTDINPLGDAVCEPSAAVAHDKRDGLSIFIAETLHNVGCDHGLYGDELVNVIKLFVLHPDADMNVLQSKKVTCGALETSYACVIKKCFDVNDIALYDNIERLTESKVYSAVEAVYNIANYVRMEYCIKKDGIGGIADARFVR